MEKLVKALGRIGIDPYLLAILATVGVAIVLPAKGGAAHGVSDATTGLIGVLFFLYGARLSPRAAWEGATHWRLQLAILLSTFALFPLLGLAARVAAQPLVGAKLAHGLLFLTLLPSTVQSSIAFTTIAGGSTAAAVCAASFSSLVGIVLTPVLASLLMGGGSVRVNGGSIGQLLLQLLLPFVLGQLSRRWTARWLSEHRRVTMLVDRGSILVVVYGAFSEGMAAGVWHSLSPLRLLELLLCCGALLAVALTATGWSSRRLGFSRADRIAIVFCGSKKSLASGLPMAAVLFSKNELALMALPLMLFHQVQLMVCTVLSRRWAAHREPPETPQTPQGAGPQRPVRLGPAAPSATR